MLLYPFQAWESLHKKLHSQFPGRHMSTSDMLERYSSSWSSMFEETSIQHCSLASRRREITICRGMSTTACTKPPAQINVLAMRGSSEGLKVLSSPSCNMKMYLLCAEKGEKKRKACMPGNEGKQEKECLYVGLQGWVMA